MGESTPEGRGGEHPGGEGRGALPRGGVRSTLLRGGEHSGRERGVGSTLLRGREHPGRAGSTAAGAGSALGGRAGRAPQVWGGEHSAPV